MSERRQAIDRATREMTEARRGLGDLDTHLVLMAVMSRIVDTPHAGLVEPVPSTNVQSIADSIDMPRETVRRKVKSLEQMGFIVRVAGLICGTALGFEYIDNHVRLSTMSTDSPGQIRSSPFPHSRAGSGR